MEKNKYALIPAYKPDQKLVTLVQNLKELGYYTVVVDDGSGLDYSHIFESVSEQAHVIISEENQGKGAALKKGLLFIKNFADQEYTVVTLDSDGQHKIKDVLAVSNMAETDRDKLIIGSRRFKVDVPMKSKLGNNITRKVFQLVTGIDISDTQTGLRAFSNKLIPFLLQIEGNRYEYEMNMLLDCVEEGIEISEIPIETVYIDDNKGSHFNPLKDSIKIYKQILMHLNMRFKHRKARI